MIVSSVQDLKEVSDKMHDSEFSENDFWYKGEEGLFQIRTSTPVEKFILKLCNVIEYHPVNLEKIKMRKATAGVFDEIKIKNSGLDLTITSQDLSIKLKLSKLEGNLEIE